jgi:TolA-binding protein
MRQYPGKAEDAMFFYAASFFRESKWLRAQREFKRLIGRFPNGRWAAGAQWHVAVCDLRMGHVARGRARLEWILRRYPNDKGTVQLARDELEQLRRRRGGVLLDLWDRLLGRS